MHRDGSGGYENSLRISTLSLLLWGCHDGEPADLLDPLFFFLAQLFLNRNTFAHIALRERRLQT